MSSSWSGIFIHIHPHDFFFRHPFPAAAKTGTFDPAGLMARGVMNKQPFIIVTPNFRSNVSSPSGLINKTVKIDDWHLPIALRRIGRQRNRGCGRCQPWLERSKTSFGMGTGAQEAVTPLYPKLFVSHHHFPTSITVHFFFLTEIHQQVWRWSKPGHFDRSWRRIHGRINPPCCVWRGAQGPL